jgi:hypothetical protein
LEALRKVMTALKVNLCRGVEGRSCRFWAPTHPVWVSRAWPQFGEVAQPI